MLFGLSNNALFAVGAAAFVWMYGETSMPAAIRTAGGPGIAAAVAGIAAYYLGLGDMILGGMLGM